MDIGSGTLHMLGALPLIYTPRNWTFLHFETGSSLCSLSCPGTPCRSGWPWCHRDSPAFGSSELGVKGMDHQCPAVWLRCTYFQMRFKIKNESEKKMAYFQSCHIKFMTSVEFHTKCKELLIFVHVCLHTYFVFRVDLAMQPQVVQVVCWALGSIVWGTVSF